MSTIINQFLFESSPKKPNDIVLKNEYYPSGLSEFEIYYYYIRNKSKLLNWIGNRRVSFFLSIDENLLVVKRKINERDIKLTTSNYDDIISGRTLCILVEHPSISNYIVIDVDAGRNITSEDTNKAIKVAQKLLVSLNFSRWEKLTTSEVGRHLIGYLDHKINTVVLKDEVEKLLNKQSDYLVNKKGKLPNTINYDLSSNYLRGLHLARYSLTKLGTICDDLSSNKAGLPIK